MSDLTFREKRLISEVLEFGNGYVFTTLGKYESYNKTTTRDIIFGACGIDIYKDIGYVDLSQQKCLERIWEVESNQIAGAVLKDFLQFYIEHYPPALLEEGEKLRYIRCCEVAERLLNSLNAELPFSFSERLKVLKSDIQKSVSAGTPQLCLDRLHTFSTEYLREICTKHGIETADNMGNNHPLHSLIGSLRKYYEESEFIESEFSLIAIRNSISLFAKYNDIRNDKSYAHPNDILNKAEAMYVIQIMSSTLTFIEHIEALIDEKEGRSWIHDYIV